MQKSINELQKIIRISYRAEINIIDSVHNILRWAEQTTLDVPQDKRTIIIAPQGIIDALNNTLLSKSIMYIDVNKKAEDISIIAARFLSCRALESIDEEKEVITLSLKEAEVLYGLYIENSKLTKNNQNTKYRIMKKLNLQNHFQLFIWWMLTDLMPQSQLKNKILVK